jgi:hypothetical protein
LQGAQEGVLMNLRSIFRENYKQLLFVFLAFSLMVVVSYFFTDGIVARQVSTNVEGVFHLAEAVIRSDLREMELTLINAAHMVQEKLDGGQSSADIQAYLRELHRWLSIPENSPAGYMNIRGYIQGAFVDALELGNFADLMEKAANAGDEGTIKGKTGDLLSSVMALINSIRTALAARQTVLEFRDKTDVSLLRLDLLKKAIITLDIDSVNKTLVDYLSMPMDSETKAKANLIEQYILMFEYDRAVAAIDKMLKE